MLSRLFYCHGRLCASHPWEVIVAFLTLTVCTLSMGTLLSGTKLCAWNPHCVLNQETKGIDVVVMTIMRCMALLYVYHQFRKLYKLGSKYLLGIAGLFTVFSSVVFSSSVVNLLDGNFTELNEALPFFLLLIDLSKAGLLAQFALSSGTQAEVRENIARGMALLGPSITLDTLVETLVIGVGTLSGVKHLEEVCCFACLSALVNYVVFMTFFPACLSLILELSRERGSGSQTSMPSAWQASLARVLHLEQQQKANPVLQRVKVIMSAGLMAVHAHSRWPLVTPPGGPPMEGGPLLHGGSDDSHNVFLNSVTSPWTQAFLRWFTVGSDQIVMLVLACALAVKYIFFESHKELREQLMTTSPVLPDQELPGATTAGKASQHRLQHSQTSPDLLHHPACCAARARFILGGDSEESREVCAKASQTESASTASTEDDVFSSNPSSPLPPRSPQQCLEILNSQDEDAGPGCLSDEEVILLVEGGHLPSYQLEGVLGDPQRGVAIRRTILCRSLCQLSEQKTLSDTLVKLPYRNYDYSLVLGACCENVIGYMPVPVGVAGPLLLDGHKYHVPMATTEGCLVASTNRGCRALAHSGGVKSSIIADGMTRGPVIRLPSAQEAACVMRWLQQKENFETLKKAFDSTSRFARLQNLQARIAGRLLFIRFVGITGDAMGMNMLSKGVEISLGCLQEVFPALEVISLSGNFCTDKKPAAINWLEGRGKSVVCEAQIPAHVVRNVLKTSGAALIDVNLSKNLIGSAMAGSIGGFNAQAANIVTAIYIATGQDPAQNVGSSNCITLMEVCGESGEDLYISCTMPSIEIGTVGGGTVLPPQAACLELLGVRGPCLEKPGENAGRLARVVCGTVLAGELSLLSALAAGHLVRSHMKHNRSQAAINVNSGSMTN